MQASRSRDVRQAFIVSDADLRHLINRVGSLVGTARMSVSCVDGVSRSFVDLAELDLFGNPYSKRIVSLTVRARNNETNAEADISFRSGNDGAIRFSVSGPEDRVLAVSDMLEAQLDAVRPWYSAVARINFIFAFPALAVAIVLLIFMGVALGLLPLAPSSTGGFAFNRSSVIGFLAGIAPFPVGWLCNRVRSMVFPFGEFALGDGASRFRRRETIRTTVVVAFGISVAAGVVSAWMLNR